MTPMTPMTRTRIVPCFALVAALVLAACGEPEAESTGSDPSVEAPEHTLSPEDAKLAEAQRLCPVSDEVLGEMGEPVKVMVGDRAVFICCEGCRKKLLADTDRYLAKLRRE
ncbi:MAG: hypothetical protein ACYTGZ_17320 [Planctomycetota bacterium]|jgi:hypothetical protein